MFSLAVDSSSLVRRFSKLVDLTPSATARALNTSAFEVRSGWVAEVKRAFDRPTPLTQRAPLYRKAAPNHLVAEVFIRSEAAKGTPPSQYLLPEVRGGPRSQKSSERLLHRLLGFPAYWVPGPGAPRDSYGNVPGSFIMKVLASVQATADPQQRTPGRKISRRSRGKRRLFFIPRAGVPTKLKRTTIYERKPDGSISPVLIGIARPPIYKPRFDAYGIAHRIFFERFNINLSKELSRIGA